MYSIELLYSQKKENRLSSKLNYGGTCIIDVALSFHYDDKRNNTHRRINSFNTTCFLSEINCFFKITQPWFWRLLFYIFHHLFSLFRKKLCCKSKSVLPSITAHASMSFPGISFDSFAFAFPWLLFVTCLKSRDMRWCQSSVVDWIRQ